MRGVEAPFQLVVSVIAMLMVLLLAYSVLSNAQKEDCGRKWEIELSKFSSALSTVIHGSAPTKVTGSFDFRCGEAEEYTLELKSTDDAQLCLRICGSAEGGGCTFFHLRTLSRKGEVLGEVFSCVEGASDYVPVTSSCPNSFEDISESIKNGIKLNKPFGNFLMKRNFGPEEPISICIR